MQRRRPFTLKSIEERLDSWLKKYASLMRQAEVAPIRQNMMVLLAFIRDNKVIGTQSTGNMPLKVVREVTARFVNPPQLDTKIGDQTFQLRSEEEVWPLYFLHILADVGGLIKTGRARRWQITAQAKRLLATPAPVQTAFLLGVWWHKVNWLVAYPYAGMGDHLPYFFAKATLASLRTLPTGTNVSFSDYAAKLISLGGLTWTAQDSHFADSALRASVERMVVDILADFGALKCRYRKEPLGKGTITKLAAIQATPWGKALLDAVAIIGG
jgi:hypothetical protein